MTADGILRKFDFYRRSSQARQQEIAAAATAVHLGERTPFYHEGDLCPHFGLVGRGDIRVFKAGPTGREITLYHVRDGEPCLVNMLCVVLARGAMASAVVDVPTDAVVVPSGTVRRWLATDDTFRSFVFETMASRLVDVMTLAAEISISRMDARLAGLLLRIADRPDGIDAVESTHEELATELGTAREVVSRLLKEFERAGVLRLRRGHLTITDRAGLKEIVDSAPARVGR